MPRWAWSNRTVTANDAMVSEGDGGPGLEALADLSLDTVYKGTMRIRLFKSNADGLVSIVNCEFLSFRPAAQSGGGTQTRAINVSQTVSDTTAYFGESLPGAVISADIQVRPPGGNVGSFVTQGTFVLTLVLRNGIISTSFEFTGPFARA